GVGPGPRYGRSPMIVTGHRPGIGKLRRDPRKDAQRRGRAMIAILGTGKMGEALLSGLLRAGRSPDEIVATARRPERAEALRKRYGVRRSEERRVGKECRDER